MSLSTVRQLNKRRKQPGPITGEIDAYAPDLERTVPMEWETALMYRAAMLRAGYVVYNLVAARPEGFYLRFQRPKLDTWVPSQEHLRELRIQRGVEQFKEMLFAPVRAIEPTAWNYCTHVYPDGAGAPVYTTHVELGCSCPDYTYRKHLTDGMCKHQVALAIWQGRDLMAERLAALERLRVSAGMVSLSATAADRRAWALSNIDKDF